MADQDKEISPSQIENTTFPSSPETLVPKIQVEINTPALETLKSTAQSKERLDQIRQAIESLSSNNQPSTHTPSHTELNSDFFSVDDYFKRGNTHKTGYAILGYESLAPITFWESIIDSAKKYLPDRSRRKRMADIGCAYGYLLKHIAPDFDETIGLDISPTALKKAKESSPSSSLLQSRPQRTGPAFWEWFP